MKFLVVISMLVVSLLTSAQALFTGDVKLACEAILCLSTSSPPSECTPSLQRYYGIQRKTLSETLKARKKFLRRCPVASQKVQGVESTETQ